MGACCADLADSYGAGVARVCYPHVALVHEAGDGGRARDAGIHALCQQVIDVHVRLDQRMHWVVVGSRPALKVLLEAHRQLLYDKLGDLL